MRIPWRPWPRIPGGFSAPERPAEASLSRRSSGPALPARARQPRAGCGPWRRGDDAIGRRVARSGRVDGRRSVSVCGFRAVTRRRPREAADQCQSGHARQRRPPRHAGCSQPPMRQGRPAAGSTRGAASEPPGAPTGSGLVSSTSAAIAAPHPATASVLRHS